MEWKTAPQAASVLGGGDPNPSQRPEVEIYTSERIAEFLLNNAVSERDYQAAVQDVIAMGIDPGTVPHDPF